MVDQIISFTNTETEIKSKYLFEEDKRMIQAKGTKSYSW